MSPRKPKYKSNRSRGASDSPAQSAQDATRQVSQEGSDKIDSRAGDSRMPAASGGANKKAASDKASLDLQSQKPFLISIGVVTLLLVVIIPIPLLRERITKNRIAEAVDFIGSGDKKQAIALLEELVREMPFKANLHMLLAPLYLEEGMLNNGGVKIDVLNKALVEYQTTVRLTGNNSSANQGMAVVFLYAARAFRKDAEALRARSNDKRDLQKVEADEKKADGYLDEALNLLQAAQRADRDSAMVNLRLGEVYEEKGDLVNAAKSYSVILYNERYGKQARERLQAIERETIGDI